MALPDTEVVTMLAAGLQGAFDVSSVVPGAVCHRGVTFAERSGHRPLLLDLYVPAGVRGPVPCVVWVHGGGWELGDRRFPPESWPDGLLFGALVEAGLAVATVDYRLSGEAVHPAQIEDVRTAVTFLHERAEALGIDPQRFGVCGESAGGHLAALLALTGSGTTAVRAAAILYGVTDLTSPVNPVATEEERRRTPEARLLGAPPEEVPDLARDASPLHRATASAPSTLLISGDADTVVPVEQTRRLHDALVAAGVPDVVLELVPGADHCFEGVDPVPALRTVVDFLADRL